MMSVAAFERVDLRAEADAAVHGSDANLRVFCEFVRCTAICSASSRVGARISARVLPRGRSKSAGESARPKAADFPLPVSALARTSRPSNAGGIERSWIGVGSVKPMSLTARRSSGCKPSSSKVG